MKNISAAAIFVFLFSCNAVEQRQNEPAKQPASPKAGMMRSDADTLNKTFQPEDTATAAYPADRLKPIRENFKRINSIAKWTSVTTKELAESTEGGEAVFYSYKGVLEKMTMRQLGETYQQLTEYYLLNGNLSFVFEKAVRYNRPIYYDSAAMKENRDDQAFDLKMSKVSECRSYFENGKLIRQINSRNDHSTPAGGYLPAEQKRIMADYDKLKTMLR